MASIKTLVRDIGATMLLLPEIQQVVMEQGLRDLEKVIRIATNTTDDTCRLLTIVQNGLREISILLQQQQQQQEEEFAFVMKRAFADVREQLV